MHESANTFPFIEELGCRGAAGRAGGSRNNLSTSHRDAPMPICPLAALGSEVARSGGETKAAATEVLEKRSSLSLTVGPDPSYEVMRSSPSPP